MAGPGTAMAPVGASFSLLIPYKERILRLAAISSPSLDLVGPHRFVSCPVAMSFFQMCPALSLLCQVQPAVKAEPTVTKRGVWLSAHPGFLNVTLGKSRER